MNFRTAAAMSAFAFSMACPLAAGASTYTFDVLDIDAGSGASASSQTYSINDLGVVADMVFPYVGGGYTSEVRKRDLAGHEDLVPLGSGYYSIYEGRHPQINDVGQVLMESTYEWYDGLGHQHLGQKIEIVEPDGTRRAIALQGDVPAGTTVPVFYTTDGFRAAINDNGEVAALVTTLDGKVQIVKFAADGSSYSVIAEEGPDLFSFEGVDINNQGKVAFTATEYGNVNPAYTTTVGVWVGDESGIVLGATSENGIGVSGRAALNDNGDIAVALVGPDSGAGPDGAGLLIQKADGSPAQIIPMGDILDVGYVQGVNLNNYGQVAYTLGNELYVDGVKIAGIGDDIGAGVITPFSGAYGPVGLRHDVSFNDSGQVVFLAQTAGGGGPSTDHVIGYRADPEGASTSHPLVPFATTADGHSDIALDIYTGLGLGPAIYIDPVVATGFTYTQGAGGANFASLVIPDALAGGQADFLLEFLYGAGSFFSGSIGVGSVFDFTAYDLLGISQFTIKGIDLSEAVDPNEPFIVGLTFVSGGFSSTLSIDAITEDTDGGGSPVPLPAGAFLLRPPLADWRSVGGGGLEVGPGKRALGQGPGAVAL